MFNRNNISLMQKPYQAVVEEGKWESLVQHFDDDEGFSISYPIMTVAKDSAFHIAVHSKSEEPLKQLLERVQNSEHSRDNVLNTYNAYENTVLHEAAINHNIAAVKLLVGGGYVTPEQLLERNMSGQTPLFKAAAFGSTKVVKYLASQPNQMTSSDDGHKKLADNHYYNSYGFCILHSAVLGEHFGTAIELLKLDKKLAYLTTGKGMTSLHLLANLQSAFTKKYSNQLWHKLLYFCIPTGDYDNYDDADTIDEDKDDVEVQYVVEFDDNICEDDDDKAGDNQSVPSTFQAALETLNKSFWKCFIRDGKWPIVRKIWKEKRKLKFAFMLALKLIKIDDSWEGSHNEDTTKHYKPNINELNDTVTGDNQPFELVNNHVETPLLAATRTGVIRLVMEILKKHPQAVEHVSHKKQNILHVAASYRRREIFEHVKKMEIPRRRLIMGIDDDGYTVLHHVADTTNYTGGTLPGPAYQLQDELQWFQMVEEIMPSYFTQHLIKNNSGKSMTAKDLFREMHQKQLEEAQKWIKDTSQSCSAVAVLVATVVFAAAFTVPGGNDEKEGFPLLLHSPFFMSFTFTDVVSLSCSLTALALFLSILTSRFDLDNFRASLPQRLTVGFALLFMSVATTMLAFTFTIILIIRSDQRQKRTLTLVCCAAFFPVSVLALTHFPLIASFIRASKNIFKFIWNVPPFIFLQKLVHRYLPSKDQGNV